MSAGSVDLAADPLHVWTLGLTVSVPELLLLPTCDLVTSPQSVGHVMAFPGLSEGCLLLRSELVVAGAAVVVVLVLMGLEMVGRLALMARFPP